MLDVQTGNPQNIWLLIVIAIGLAAAIYSTVARKRSLNLFSTGSHSRNHARVTGKKWISTLLIVTALLLLTIALLDIRWGKTFKEIPQKGIEVLFVLDVSRSMLAEDASPNRLNRAKQQIKDMVDEMAGDRIGLIVFAGEARQAVPLTSHHEDFRQTLDLIGTQSVRLGGSRLGDALTKAGNSFIDQTNNHKAIVVFTDGEDQESEPLKVARELHEQQGVRIFTVGLGDMDQGARIPERSNNRRSFVEYEGQQVWSKMNGQILRQIATETSGAYIPAGTKQVNMADVYNGYLAKVDQKEFEQAKINAYIPRFQWFAVPALCLLIAESIWMTRRRSNSIAATYSIPNKMAAAILAMCIFASPETGLAQSPTDSVSQPTSETIVQQINTANQLVRDGELDSAITSYQQLPTDKPHQDVRDYNLAVAYFRKGDHSAAEKLFSQTARSLDSRIAANSRYNLGNCRYAQALQLAESKKTAAIDQLRSAITDYRSSLRLDSQNQDARANIELALQLIRKLEEEQQQEQEDRQNQQQQNDQQQDQQDQSGQQQNRSDQNNKESQSENGEGDKQPEEKSAEPKTNEVENRQQPSDQQNASTSSGELDSANPSSDLPQTTPAQTAQKEENTLMTKEEALKLLQSVRDRDMLRRLRQEQVDSFQRVPVEKDW